MTIAVLLAACTITAGQYADRACTPGDVITTARSDICTSGWATAHRNVTYPQRRRIFARYGIPYDQHRQYELDHLIPLEAGGSNADTNLFPQPWAAARRKDNDEDRAHAGICTGRKTVAQTQRWIVRRWTRTR